MCMCKYTSNYIYSEENIVSAVKQILLTKLSISVNK